MKNMKAGTEVLVRKWKSVSSQDLNYAPFRGKLTEFCNGEGWDVVDVRRKNGRLTSVYSFCVEPSLGR